MKLNAKFAGSLHLLSVLAFKSVENPLSRRIIGLVIAVLAGLFFQPEWAIWVLAILGVIVSLLNVTAEDTRPFLLAAIALTLSATALNTIPFVGTSFTVIMSFVAAFIAGATLVVAFKELFQTARRVNTH